MNTDFNSLIEKHLNATLTAAEATQLVEAMADDPAVAEHFASLTRLDADLSIAAKEGGRTALYTRRMERAAAETAPVRARNRLPVKTMAAAAGLAVLIGAGWRLLEGPGRPGSSVQKGKSGSAREKSSGDGALAALAGNPPAMDSASMKKALRRFFVPAMNVRQRPVSQALAALQQQWKDGASESDEETAAVAFTIADSVRHRWPKPEDEPVVSLEIPGVSLLTNLELLAAQSGLKTVITGDGVNLEEDTRASDAKERTWTIPLSQATLIAFINKAGATPGAGQNQSSLNNFIMGSSSWGAIEDNQPSWLAPPRQDVAVVDSGLQQPVKWIYDFGDQAWFENALQVTRADQAPAAAWGLIQAPGRAELSSVLAGDLLANIADPVPAGTQSFTFNSAVYPSELSNAAGVQFSPDGKQIIAAGADGTAKIWDAATGQPVAPPQSYADYDVDGYTIDLNLAPEIVESEGFINYGTPLQTTGLNVPGQVDWGVLTGSGITQPVFAAVRRKYPENLTRLLTAHGMPAAGASWNPETGILKASGSLRSLRAAHAAAAAIEESATAGVAVDMRIIEWKDGQSPTGADPDMILPPAETAVILTATEAHTLLRLPNASLKSVSRTEPSSSSTLSLDDGKDSQPLPSGESIYIGTKVAIQNASRCGSSLSAEVQVVHTRLSGYELIEGARYPVPSSSVSRSTCKLEEGQWLRFDFPAAGQTKATSVLLNIRAARVNLE